MSKNLVYGLYLCVGLALAAFLAAMRGSFPILISPPSSIAPIPPSEQTQQAIALTASQKKVAETLASADRMDLTPAQMEEFEQALRTLYASPLRGELQEKLRRYERSLPLFMASEQTLFSCLKGSAREPQACEPSADYIRLLERGVSDGDISRQEADKYLEILRSMKDPAKRPVLPQGGLSFMEKESRMRIENLQKIVASSKKAEML